MVQDCNHPFRLCLKLSLELCSSSRNNCSLPSIRKSLTSQGGSVIQKLWHTGLNTWGNLGSHRMSFLVLIHVDSQKSSESCCFQSSARLGQARGSKRQLEGVRGKGERKNVEVGWDDRDPRCRDSASWARRLVLTKWLFALEEGTERVWHPLQHLLLLCSAWAQCLKYGKHSTLSSLGIFPFIISSITVLFNSTSTHLP